MTEKKKQTEKIIIDTAGVTGLWEEAKTDITLREENKKLKNEIELLKAERIYFRGLYDGARGKEPGEVEPADKDERYQELVKKMCAKSWGEK
jgi:hypothetical protein